MQEKTGQYVPYWALPNATIFFSSACIMVMELVAGRLIARHVGMSLYTWTAIIGVVMAGISLGNFIGGRVADRYSPRRALVALFFLAAIGCAAILPLNTLMGLMPFFAGLSWPLRIFLHVFFVFMAPSTALGIINPVVAKMALDYKRAAGRTVGGVFASGVAGSLVGTFAAGYYLVMYWGATTIVLFSAAGLAALGVLYLLLVRFGRDDSAVGDGASPSEAPPLRETLHEWAPAAATVFMSNMAFMVFELAAMRVISREFGSSLYTWTTVIGVVLAGISLGNYLGGRFADRSHSTKMIARVFALSALTVLISPLWGSYMSVWRTQVWQLAQLSWPMQIFSYVVVFCFIPCVFIGMVSPIVTRRLLAQGRAPGASVGAVYAWGSVGAIAGTFLAGYFLIQWMGSLPVIALTAVSLAAVALVYAPRKHVAVVLTVFCALAFLASLAPQEIFVRTGVLLRLRVPAAADVVYEDESQYSYIAIKADPDDPMVREMLLDQLIHTRIDLRDPTLLLYEYEWVYSAVMSKRHVAQEAVRAFVIGGGGYAYPNYLAHARPGSRIVVAEIDPAVTEAAHAALGLPRDTDIEIYNMDARNVAVDLIRQRAHNEDAAVFDYIFGDSINDYTVPHHLTTIEFKQMVSDLLAEDGIYMLNMIDMLDSGGFLAAVVNTCRAVFPHVTVFNTGRHAFIRDTFVVVCTKQPLPLDDIPALLRSRHDYTGRILEKETMDALIEKRRNMILTDDFAPVENLIAPVVRSRAGDAGELNLHFARRYAARGDIASAIQRCRAAIAVHPRWPDAYELLAELLFQQGDVEEALEALVGAVDGHQDPVAAWYRVGREAMNAGQHDLAIEAWGNCVALQPSHVPALYNLGVLYGARNQLHQAINAWKQAVAQQPDHEDSLYNLAAAYVMTGDGAAAASVLELMREQGIAVDPALQNAVTGMNATAPLSNQEP